MQQFMEKYNDIIYNRHPVSFRHRRMSKLIRASQFSPFAALTGFDDIIDESARETLPFSDPGCDLAEETGRILSELICGAVKAECSVTYFVPDSKKSGGEYRTERSRIMKYDEINGTVKFDSGVKINILSILNIEITGNGASA